SMDEFIPPSVEKIREKVEKPDISEKPKGESLPDEAKYVEEPEKKSHRPLKRKEEFALKTKNELSSGKEKLPRKDCQFLKPAKQTVDGKVIVKKRCVAFVPPFDVDEERKICKDCKVPKVIRPGKSCKYITPLDMVDGEARFMCSKTNKKYIQVERCTPEDCDNFEI
ncbi:MAG: hypothetical protein J7M18_00230, partial [Candidatus Eremiobacteraeota bacterium]|nr:hypothetical protein [Candidatus Eremiobacteraeota bacterium]